MSGLTKVIAEATSKMLFRAAEVVAVTEHGQRFRSIELSGEALKKATWQVGDKLQVRIDPDGFATRTYTPYSWDRARGSTRLLAYAHGTGPGSAWIRRAGPGVACQVFGPQGSIKLGDLGSVLFIGDETSFALAAAWQGHTPGSQALAYLFEVTDSDESHLVLDAIDLSSPHLFARREDSAHLDRLSAKGIDLLRTHPDASLCITGKAQTIAVIRRNLKAAGLAGRPTRVKAYWDEHRSGLD
jgi:ferric-chelate reductase (NADPH)